MPQDPSALPQPPASTGGASPAVALLLPLSGRTSGPAEAVRDGFLAAYLAVDSTLRPRLLVLDCAHDAAAAYQEALAAGAGYVVGPLTKEEVATVSAAIASGAPAALRTLVLNVAPEGAATGRIVQFALSPEDEARQVAARLISEGKPAGVVLAPTGDWGHRVVDAFDATLTAGGGHLLGQKYYAPGTTDFGGLIAELVGFDDSRARHRALVAAVGVPLEFTPRRRDSVSFLFMAGQPNVGRLIRPQLKFHYAGELPIYATSDMYEPSPTANQDLDGLIFPDMPFMLATDAATMAEREDSQALWSEATRRRSRLYAFGMDAYRLIAELQSMGTLRDSVAGMTGKLSLDADGRVRRQLDWAQIQADGTIRPLGAPLSATSPP